MKRRVFASLLLLASLPLSASGQTVGTHSLNGDWVRVTSNNNPNDQMRITVAGDATLTTVPLSASASWSVGQVLWTGIQADGTLQVRGSDGQYYPATLAFKGPDLVDLVIGHGGAGYTQTWRRAGPDISGDWVRIGPPGSPGDGTRIQVLGTDASVRYLPATAPRAWAASCGKTSGRVGYRPSAPIVSTTPRRGRSWRPTASR